MLMSEKNASDARETERCAYRTDQQQGFAAELVDHGHAQESGEQVHASYGHCLQVAREFVESRGGKNVVQIIKDGIDAGELVEHADGDGQENWESVLAAKERLILLQAFEMDGADDFLQLGFRIVCAHFLQDLARFVYAPFGDQPARTWRDAEEHDQKQDGRQRGDAKLPAPVGGTETLARDYEIREISQQDADDDVDLKHADQAAADSRRGEFRDVNGTKDRGAADAETSKKSREKQDLPIPGKRAAQGGEHVKDSQNAEGFSRAVFLAGDSGGHGADDCANQGDGDGEAELPRRQTIREREGMGGAGDYGGVEAEQESTERADGGGLEEVGIKFHRMFAMRVRTFGRLYSSARLL